MGLGGIYAGIGLAQGLGSAGNEFLKGRQEQQEADRKAKLEKMQMDEIETRQRIEKENRERTEAFSERSKYLSGKKIDTKAKVATGIGQREVGVDLYENGGGDPSDLSSGIGQQDLASKGSKEPNLKVKSTENYNLTGDEKDEELKGSLNQKIDDYQTEMNAHIEEGRAMALRTGNQAFISQAVELETKKAIENFTSLMQENSKNPAALSLIAEKMLGQKISFEVVDSDSDGKPDNYKLKDLNGLAFAELSPQQMMLVKDKESFRAMIAMLEQRGNDAVVAYNKLANAWAFRKEELKMIGANQKEVVQIQAAGNMSLLLQKERIGNSPYALLQDIMTPKTTVVLLDPKKPGTPPILVPEMKIGAYKNKAMSLIYNLMQDPNFNSLSLEQQKIKIFTEMANQGYSIIPGSASVTGNLAEIAAVQTQGPPTNTTDPYASSGNPYGREPFALTSNQQQPPQ